MAATVPEWCLVGSRGECRLRVDYYRERATGPCFALAVVACRKHRGRFTLYPPGHVPYGRVAMAPASASGAVIVGGGDEEGSVTAWQGTVMEAALDAASGRAWRRDSWREDPKRWRTQLRWLELGAHLVGIVAGTSKRQRERIAMLLGVALVVMHEAAEHLRSGAGYRRQGEAIVMVLRELEGQRLPADRVLASGTAMGLWGRPSRWDPGGGGFRATFRPLVRAPGTELARG